jgi:membrane protease YdiL (CAAX protease family)
MGVGSRSAPQLSGAYLSAGLVIQNVLFVAVPLAYIMWRYRLTLADIGLSWPPRWRHVRIGLLGGVAVMLLGAGCEAGARALAHEIMPAHAFRMLENMTQMTDVSGMLAQLRASPAMAVNLFLGVAVLAPIGEEMFFRGFLHNCARRRLGAFWGTLLSATAFALAHGGPLTMPAILPMGILLAVAYDMTGSLWVSMTMHGVNNGIMVLAILLFPGLAK